MRKILRLYPTHAIAVADFKKKASAFRDHPGFTFYPSNLQIEGQGMNTTFRGAHDIGIYLRGRILDTIRIESGVKLSYEEETELRMATITSKSPVRIIRDGKITLRNGSTIDLSDWPEPGEQWKGMSSEFYQDY